jgi:hypothetical protein
MNREEAKSFVLGEFKKAIQQRNKEIAIDEKNWAGDSIAEAVASLIDYILQSGVITVSGAVDPVTHAGSMTGKIT